MPTTQAQGVRRLLTTLAALVLLGAGGCAGGGGSPPAALPRGGYTILDESPEAWIVKIPKEGGPAALRRAQEELVERGGGEGGDRTGPVRPGSEEIAAPPADEPVPGPIPPPPVHTGRVGGRILEGGRGVVGCRVKLTPMEKNLGILYWEESWGPQPTGLTRVGGEFEIVEVPPGAYRLKWAPPGATHWMKRLREDPDVHVVAGTLSRVPDVHIRPPDR